MKKVLLLFGGNSYEHDISILSCKNIYLNIDRNLFDVDTVYISKENIWYLFDNNFEDINANNYLKIYNIIEYLKRYDVVFNIIHGNDGEDGKLQSLFELFNIKYIGSGSSSSFICINKDITKMILMRNKINVVKEYNTRNPKFPLILKPTNLGSSIGVYKINNEEELVKKIIDVKQLCNKYMLEKYIKAREFECGILINKGNIEVSDVGEIILKKDFYDYKDKYIDNKSICVIPANIDKSLKEKIRDISKKAFTALDCKGLARIDFLYDIENDILYLNEINTLPGFTDISMYPRLFMFNGYSYKDLLSILINNVI